MSHCGLTITTRQSGGISFRCSSRPTSRGSKSVPPDVRLRGFARMRGLRERGHREVDEGGGPTSLERIIERTVVTRYGANLHERDPSAPIRALPPVPGMSQA